MLFSAEITDFRIIHQVLKAITSKEFVLVRPMEEGLKFTLEQMRSVETSVYVPKTMFYEYNLKKRSADEEDEDIIFKISLKVLTECLNIFGDDGNPSVKLSYKQEGAPLCLVITHNSESITVNCEIKTMNCDNEPDISLADECNLDKIFINADILTEILHRLDNCADEITITISPDAPNFTLATKGIAGEAKISLSKHADSISVFESSQKVFQATYALCNLRQIMKVMNYASKVTLSTGESGLLGIQLLIESEEKQLYVQCYVTSQFEERD